MSQLPTIFYLKNVVNVIKEFTVHNSIKELYNAETVRVRHCRSRIKSKYKRWWILFAKNAEI